MSTQASSVPTGTNVNLARVIADVESNSRYGALRFERRVFNRITDQGSTPVTVAIAKACNCSSDTAKMIYSTSWGAFQIMGFNIYDKAIGYTGDISTFLFNQDTQVAAFNTFIKTKGIEYSIEDLKDEHTRNTFAVTYNGSTDYAVRVLASMKRLGLA